MKRLLALVAALVLVCSSARASTLTGTLRDAAGNTVNGTLWFQLDTTAVTITSGGCPTIPPSYVTPFTITPGASVSFPLVNGTVPGGSAITGTDCMVPSTAGYWMSAVSPSGAVLLRRLVGVTGNPADIGNLGPPLGGSGAGGGGTGSGIARIDTTGGVAGGPIVAPGSGTLSLDTTGMASGSCTNCSLTTNAQGRVQALSSGSAQVPTSRTITTTTPLSINGVVGGSRDLSTNITIAIQQASTSLSGFLTSTDWNTFNGKVPPSRLITVNPPLQGGGSLTADVFIGCGVAGPGGDGCLASTDWISFNAKVPQTRIVAATAPLTGGGALTGNIVIGCPTASAVTSGCLSSSDWSTFNTGASGAFVTLANPPQTVTGNKTFTGGLNVFSGTQSYFSQDSLTTARSIAPLVVRSNSAPANTTITGATFASPIVISTTAPMAMATGDHIVVSGVGGNTAANGSWTVTRNDSTHFILQGSVGNAAYTFGGRADISYAPSFPDPSIAGTGFAYGIQSEFDGSGDGSSGTAAFLVSSGVPDTWNTGMSFLTGSVAAGGYGVDFGNLGNAVGGPNAIHLPNNGAKIVARNAANTADLPLLGMDGNNRPVLGPLTYPAADGTVGQLLRTLGTGVIAVSYLSAISPSASVATTEGTASTTYVDLTTAGPSVTVTTGSTAIIMFQATAIKTAATVGGTAYISIAVSGASTIAASDTVASVFTQQSATTAALGMVDGQVRIGGLTPGSNTFTMKYRVDSFTFNFSNRSIIVIP